MSARSTGTIRPLAAFLVTPADPRVRAPGRTRLNEPVPVEHRASLSAAERESERIEIRRKKRIEMVMDGVAPSVVEDELNANAARREQLEAQLAATEEPLPLLHPEMARIYEEKVSGLATALQEPDKPVRGNRGSARPRGRYRAHARLGWLDASDRAERKSGGHAGGHRTNEEVVGFRRPLPASIDGCGGGI